MAVLGWIVEMKDTLGAPGSLFAVIADSSVHATIIIRDHFRTLRPSIKTKKPLSKDEIDRLGLKQGDVRRIWNDTADRKLERLRVDIAVDGISTPERQADSPAVGTVLVWGFSQSSAAQLFGKH